MLLILLSSLAFVAVAVILGALYYRVRVARRRTAELPPLVWVTPEARRTGEAGVVAAQRVVHEPEQGHAVAASDVPPSPLVTPVPPVAEESEAVAAAEAEARQILEVAANAARALLEEAEETRARAAEELAAARAKAEEEVAAAKRRMDVVRRTCIEELAQLESRKSVLARECREMQAAIDTASARAPR